MASFHFMSTGCSWYEHHMLGGCPRPSSELVSCLGGASTQAASPAETASRLIVIVPFRGDTRGASVEGLCSRLPEHLEQHGIEFTMLLVNQVDLLPFNRGALVNAGFSAIVQQRVKGIKFHPESLTYIAVQDVDRFPWQNNQSCAPDAAQYYSDPGPTPRVLHPTSYTGGVLLLRSTLFQALNGFSNQFWGWGHEDNELYLRMRRCGVLPEHAPRIQWCMEHQDCSECKRAKPAEGTAYYQAETKNIALVQERLRHPGLIIKDDGLSSVRFTAVNRTQKMKCGKRHTIRLLDVRLHRSSDSNGACIADGSALDNGCVAGLAPEKVPQGVIDCVRSALPRASHITAVVSATRHRVLYNFHYEVDVQISRNSSSLSTAGQSISRVAVCAQEWQGMDVPSTSRYHPLWRATRSRRKGGPHFLLSENFHYKGHFPCSLTPLPGSITQRQS